MWLKDITDSNPNLVDYEVYGKSHEGRDLILITVTDKQSGPSSEKPAHWVDGKST